MDTAEEQKKAVLAFRHAFKSTSWAPLTKVQARYLRERPLKGPVLVSSVKIPCPSHQEEETLRSSLWDVFESKREGLGLEKLDPPAPCAPSYSGEWIAVRKNAKAPDAAAADLSDKEKFDCIQQHQQTDTTLFYVPGGGWFRGGPPAVRPMIKQLCDHSGSRAFTFQYRLAPQYTIPTILLDVILAYFYLLSPPPSSFHEPVDPNKIILLGDSAGANLLLGLLQFLQFSLRSAQQSGISNPTIRLHGRDIPIQMPSGCAFVGPALDLALSLPSVKKFEKVDWLSEGAPWLQPNFPADSIWPSDPPRGDLHCDNSALCHPLVDPSTCTDWTGIPPVWMACGEETYSDGAKFLAKNMKASGVPVTFVQYEFMPHVWNMVMPFLPQSHHLTQLWAAACRDLGANTKKSVSSEALFVNLGALETVQQDFDGLLDIPNSEVLRRMRAARDELAKYVWKGSAVGYAKL